MWNSSTSAVIGYNVYRSTIHGGPYTQVNNVLESSTSYVDQDVVGGTTYFYVVTSVDASNVESVNSNEAVVSVPSP